MVSATSPAALARTLVSSNMIASNAVLNCAEGAFGLVTFDGGHAIDDEFAMLTETTSVVLSTGSASVVEETENDNTGTTTENGFPGDADADAAITPDSNDACVLEFDFELMDGEPTTTVCYEYVFLSEEYNEFGDTFEDVFLFLVGE